MSITVLEPLSEPMVHKAFPGGIDDLREYVENSIRREREREQADIAKEQRDLAEANYIRAREAVQQMLTRVADEDLAAIPEMVEVRRHLQEDAKLFYDELIKLNPDDAHVYFERAKLRQALVEPREEVEADYKRAIQLAPSNAQFARGLSNYLRWEAFDPLGALRHALKAVEIAPDSEMAAMIAYLQRLGHLRDMTPDEPAAAAETAQAQ
jgi:tetratricopeptide (TPR) repeat protein